MNCERYLDLISARLDGPLSPADEAELTAHLNDCPACRAIAHDLANVHTTLSGAAATPPAELAEGVMTSIRGQRTARKRTFRQLGALAACLVLCVGLFALSRPQVPADEQTPMTTRTVTGRSASAGLPFSDPQRLRLSSMSTSFAPTADLLGDTEGLARCLARFPENDLSHLTLAYDEDYFRTHRLLAMAVVEPSSSITHTVATLTDNTVTVLRHVPEAGDTDVALWLILAEVEGVGPETALTVELIDN
ncbi:MAG: hypothetical protein E7450_06140 [Ruminococcaceae bacterium]|nr:hypothetical protein [Oscillospiraceae bacterium]